MQHQRERAGPEPLGEIPGYLGNTSHYSLHVGRACQKQWYRHLKGSVFHLVHSAHRFLCESMSAQRVQRIGGKGYESSPLKDGYSRLHLVFRGLTSLRATHAFP